MQPKSEGVPMAAAGLAAEVALDRLVAIATASARYSHDAPGSTQRTLGKLSSGAPVPRARR